MSLRRGLEVQSRVVWALILRETRTRFGLHRLGYIWALLEPALMILTFWVASELIGRKAPYDMDMYGFLCTGMIPYLLFMGCVGSVANSIAGNKALLYYPHVQPLDLMIARCILETATYVIVFLVLMLGRALFVHEFHVHEPLVVIEGLLIAAIMGTGFGMIWCSLAEYSPAADRIRTPLLRPLFWISGLFFCVNELPGMFRDMVLWNPLIHPAELIRDGWYASYTAHYVDRSYALAYCLVFAFIGLTLERLVRSRIQVT